MFPRPEVCANVGGGGGGGGGVGGLNNIGEPQMKMFHHTLHTRTNPHHHRERERERERFMFDQFQGGRVGRRCCVTVSHCLLG